VLHPLSNYREHPVDNLYYAVVTGVAAGLTLGSFELLFGVQPLSLVIPVFGIGFLAFAFNFFGYNLRHSHIWVRWPGLLAYLFGCPAHHQIHHSCKPQHINKNMAFMFPIWDVLFGTFYLPAEKEELEFGLGDGTEEEYRGYFSIYVLPFLSLIRRFRGSATLLEKSAHGTNSAAELPVPEDKSCVS
jgi:sterol desaturase/sphingolipid hydroxylase (fatty acid hydroxylase superfamily)